MATFSSHLKFLKILADAVCVYGSIWREHTKASPHCNVFIMHEYHAEFQFCKVILHLLSDAGASKRRFLNTLCIEAEESRQGASISIFSIFKGLSLHPFLSLKMLSQLSSFQLRKICRLCKRYSCRKQGKKKCLLYPAGSSFLRIWSSSAAQKNLKSLVSESRVTIE